MLWGISGPRYIKPNSNKGYCLRGEIKGVVESLFNITFYLRIKDCSGMNIQQYCTYCREKKADDSALLIYTV